MPHRWTALAVLAVLQACARRGADDRSVGGRVDLQEASAPIAPLVAPADLDPAVVALGRRLFFDPRLSADGTISCASCHDLTRGGVDGRTRSIGIGGAEGGVNAPTIYNSGFNLRQFWDGRAASLEEQVGGPVENPVEMGSEWPDVVARLGADADLRAAFADAFGGGDVTEHRIRQAIATFERSLVTVDGPFDRYLRGEADAIGPPSLRGYDLFLSYGCVSCHQGANVGGNLFQTFGVMGDRFGDEGRTAGPADQGRFNVTGREEDRYVFRVPSLRLVARTAPYFHDGSAATLDEAIGVMGRYQLGLEIPPADRADLAAFLESLAGPIGGDRVE